MSNTRANISEACLVGRLVSFLHGEGYRVRLEVPNMGQSVDIVASRGGVLTFIEAKRYDWRRALAQCRAHEAVADYICLAMLLRSVPSALLCILKELGYGFIRYEPESQMCEWVAQPMRNTGIWPPQRRKLMAAMQAIDCAPAPAAGTDDG